MKKFLMTIAAVFAAVNMNAQYYVGGSLGFSTSSDKTNPLAETTVTGFTFSPEVGMALDEKMGVGLAIDFGSRTRKVENTTANTSTDVTTTSIGLTPYVRYQFFKVAQFNVFLDGGINFDIESTKDMKPAMDLGLFATPGIAYKVNDQWSIVAKLNRMFNFGYHKDAVADVAGAPDAPTSLNANVSTGGFNIGNLTFGVYYNF